MGAGRLEDALRRAAVVAGASAARRGVRAVRAGQRRSPARVVAVPRLAVLWLVSHANLFLDETNPLRSHLKEVAPHMRMVLMGLILILLLRFRPKGILPEKAPDRY